MQKEGYGLHGSQAYNVQILATEEQFIHCQVTTMQDIQKFYITYIYGANQEGQRRVLWEALEDIAAGMEEGWCILGDFNSILYSGDRMGGMEIHTDKIKPLNDYINKCEVQELRSIGPYFTWTNKIVWTRIDRAFVNTLWYDLFDFSQVVYMTNSLSDHTALVIDTSSALDPPSYFNFVTCGLGMPLLCHWLHHIFLQLPSSKGLSLACIGSCPTPEKV